ncbi:hypothetical protein [Alteromonas lipolytica]|uniref:DUF3887 domain-containing protein n=1 Tax=Alteromonas lipolytica TaxID=1856405 RepID=A0A1E8FFF1_9ALTE|nr:hypothetical protein [Alteromonas lipolytica]OFI34654.1 hypothetical protein BFC17_13785 [Alteromonas lipolytica]GGF52940.1 hypothetical protein GCM10011338_01300 [Alteromonas lipolytica]
MNGNNDHRADYFGCYGQTTEDALGQLLWVVEQALMAHESGDYQALRAVITDSLAGKITPAGFQRAHETLAPELGRQVSKRLLGALNRGGNPRLLFVARYEGAQDDILISVTFSNHTYPPLIDELWIE